MDMDLLVPLSAIGVMMIVAVTAILARTISQHKLKVEQIKADAMVRVEEARIRNQIELERLMKEEQVKSADRSGVSVDRSEFSAGRSGVSVDRSEFSADRSGVSVDRSEFSAGRSGVSVDRSEFSAGRSGVSVDRSEFSADRSGVSAGRSALSDEEMRMNDAGPGQRSRVRD